MGWSSYLEDIKERQTDLCRGDCSQASSSQPPIETRIESTQQQTKAQKRVRNKALLLSDIFAEMAKLYSMGDDWSGSDYHFELEQKAILHFHGWRALKRQVERHRSPRTAK
jgi:hypothetical protein